MRFALQISFFHGELTHVGFGSRIAGRRSVPIHHAKHALGQKTRATLQFPCSPPVLTPNPSAARQKAVYMRAVSQPYFSAINRAHQIALDFDIFVRHP